MCGGLIMALVGGVGCFVLAMMGKDESTGEVKVGKFFTVRGVSLIVLSVCGVALMGYSVYSFTQLQKGNDGDVPYDWGYAEEDWGDDDTDFVPMDVEMAFDDDVEDPAASVLDHALNQEVVVAKGGQPAFLEQLEYIEPPDLDDDDDTVGDDDSMEEMQLLLDSLFDLEAHEP